MLQSDFIVVGGGIAGLTIAREILRRGGSVTVLDAGRAGEGTSRVAAGMLAPLVEARLSERDLLQLGVAALRYWKRFAPELEDETGGSIGYRSEGTLIVGIEPDHQAEIDHVAQEYRALGLPIEPVGYEECREIEPMLSPTVTGGLFAAEDHQVDNRSLLDRLRSFVSEHRSGEIRDGERVLEVHSGREEIGVSTERGKIGSGGVILAPGASLRRIEGIPESLRRAIRPVKGEILRLKGPEMPLLKHVIRTPEVYLVPKPDGTIVVGASTEERGFEQEVRVGPLFELLRSAWETLPGVYELPILEQNVGFRPSTLDHLPVVGPIGTEGLWVVDGFYRHGILFAPFVAAELGAYLEKYHEHQGRKDHAEQKPELPESLREFDPGRFDPDRSQR